MEQKANNVFQRYAHLYYDKDFKTSVYFIDTDMNGFISCWLVKKSLEFNGASEPSEWDATHVVKTTIDGSKARYKVTSTVFLNLQSQNNVQGKIDMAGNVTRVQEDHATLDAKLDTGDQHVAFIGRMIENNETAIRQEINGIFINKSKQIINSGRLRDEYMTPDEKGAFQQELMEAMKKNAQK